MTMMMSSTKNMDLSELIEKLHEAFDTEKDVDIDYVQDLMHAYKSNPQEWRRFAKFDRYKYTRNLVDEGNGKFNLMVLCWGEGHGTAIHDHANAHCVMKVLQGELCETQYKPPPIVNQEVTECQKLDELNKCLYKLNDVAYIHDSIGLHRLENLSTVDVAVSLHLYSPPYSKCTVFNKLTGKTSLTEVTFWSKFGERRNRDIQDSRTPEDN